MRNTDTVQKKEEPPMRKTIVQLIDDLDGSTIEEGAGGTLEFAYDGVSYEIDLTTENLERFRSEIEPYISAGRRVRATSGASRKTSAAASDPSELQAIREWAASQGIQVAARGRIAASVRDAYHAAQK